MTMRSQRLKLLEKKADEGNARAQYELGLMYYRGDGVDKNMAKARQWLSRWSAHRQCGNTTGMMKLRIWWRCFVSSMKRWRNDADSRRAMMPLVAAASSLRVLQGTLR